MRTGNSRHKKDKIMKSFKLIFGIFITCLSLSLVSCEKDDGNDNSKKDHTGSTIGGSTGGSTSTSKIKQPSLKKILTTTTTSNVSFRCIFDMGGDKKSNMRCTVYWAEYSKKPSITPTVSSLRKAESMREYASSSNTSITFDRTHAGFSGGTYIYYAFECSNSKYTTKTDVLYTIVKR